MFEKTKKQIKNIISLYIEDCKTIKSISDITKLNEKTIKSVLLTHDIKIDKLSVRQRNKLDRDIQSYVDDNYKLVDDKYLISGDREHVLKISYNTNKIVEKPLTLSNTTDYQYKRITMNGKTCYYHRVLWEAFNGAIPHKMTVDHVDGNRLNNRLDNLQLLSQSDNSRKTMVETHQKNKIWTKDRKNGIKR